MIKATRLGHVQIDGAVYIVNFEVNIDHIDYVVLKGWRVERKIEKRRGMGVCNIDHNTVRVRVRPGWYATNLCQPLTKQGHAEFTLSPACNPTVIHNVDSRGVTRFLTTISLYSLISHARVQFRVSCSKQSMCLHHLSTIR